jgi:hypothetical protein
VSASIFTRGMALALEFNLRSEPQLELARWLESKGVDVPHALNLAGPIVEHDVVVFPGAMFDFAAAGSADSVRAIVHLAVGEDAETPIDLVAWTRERPDRILRCLGVAQAIGIDQLFNPASYFAGRPLRVYRSVLAWLAASCDGVVPLDCGAIRNQLDFSCSNWTTVGWQRKPSLMVALCATHWRRCRRAFGFLFHVGKSHERLHIRRPR